MKDRDKIKGLLARMVAMTPEPPPYPEEMTMADTRSRTSTRPWLVFAGAVAVVALLGIPLLFLGGDEPPVAGEETTTTTSADPDTSTPTDTTTSSTQPTTSTTETTIPSEPSVWTGTWFLIQEPVNSFLGNPALVPVQVNVTAPSGFFEPDVNFSEVMHAYLEDGNELPGGLQSAIPEGVVVESLSEGEFDGEPVLVAEMSESFLAGAGGLLADFTMLNQLVYSLTVGAPDSPVLFTVDGEPPVAFGSEGLDLSDPVTRETFIDELNIIFLTDPVTSFEHVYVVSGRANTYEASLSIQVLDESGEVTYEEPIQATCGTGCWGEFGVGVSTELIEPGPASIRVLTYSAEDGSISHAVTIPVATEAGGVWELNIG